MTIAQKQIKALFRSSVKKTEGNVVQSPSGKNIKGQGLFLPEGDIHDELRNQKVTEIWEMSNFFGMFVPKKNGVYWSNQVGGHACLHPVVEGLYVPLPTHWLPDVSEMENIWYSKHDKKLIQKWLKSSPFLRLYFK